MFHHLNRLSSYSTGNPELIRDSINVWAKKWIFSTTQAIRVLKSSTFYSSRKSSLMTYISTSSESLSLSWYFIFRQLSGSRASLHPKSAQSARKITFRARCCTVCTQKSAQSAPKKNIPGPLLHSLHPKKTFPARCCTVCTQSLHSLHPKKNIPGPLLHSLHPKSAQSAPRSENEIARQRKRFRWCCNTCH